jgi:DNA-binding LytR/AlgR family response regulator
MAVAPIAAAPAAVADAAAPAPVPPAQPSTTLPNPLFDQLPPELGSEIIALEMEDHYVRVHTALGSALVLMRLRDAMALIGDLEGMQVHRSWWVARGAVEDVLRDGRNVRLKLARDLEAPVARANVATLRDARWF